MTQPHEFWGLSGWRDSQHSAQKELYGSIPLAKEPEDMRLWATASGVNRGQAADAT